tara:strand:+ start:138 stop:371 length:234 start_codon:yes stop_codon:yes gene_type:complete
VLVDLKEQPQLFLDLLVTPVPLVLKVTPDLKELTQLSPVLLVTQAPKDRKVPKVQPQLSPVPKVPQDRTVLLAPKVP